MTSDQYNGQSVSNKSLLRPTLFSHSPGKVGCSHVEEVGCLSEGHADQYGTCSSFIWPLKDTFVPNQQMRAIIVNLNDDKDIVIECFHLLNKQTLKHCHEQHNSFLSLDYKLITMKPELSLLWQYSKSFRLLCNFLPLWKWFLYRIVMTCTVFLNATLNNMLVDENTLIHFWTPYCSKCRYQYP